MRSSSSCSRWPVAGRSDGAELVPPSAYRATRPADPAPTGVLAKVCPVCRHRYDLSARFCGKDGHDLVVVN